MAPGLRGELSQYCSLPKLSLFESGDFDSTDVLLFVGGLYDGLGSVPYLPGLSDVLGKKNWSMVQIELSSSHTHYGLSSLESDANEMALAIAYLERERGKKRVVLMGHSTGCQDIMQLLTKPPPSSLGIEHLLAGAILQAPASDIEYFLHSASDDARAWAIIAHKMVQSGRGDEWMPKDASVSVSAKSVPFTAYRYASLYTERGDDDFFSSTIPPASLQFGLVKYPLLVLLGGSDQFYPPALGTVDALQTLLATWKKNGDRVSDMSEVLIGANHKVDDPTARKRMYEIVGEFLQSVKSG